MLEEIDQGKFLEYAHVSSNIYGTSFASIDKVISEGRSCILDIDMQGAGESRRPSLRSFLSFFLFS